MRLGEVINLRRSQVFLKQRLIFLAGMDTKEGHPERVPIHRELLPILEGAVRITSLEHDQVFLLGDKQGGVGPITKNCVELGMRRLNDSLSPSPRFRFHDLRHTWRANCSRSAASDRIAERIMGHSDSDGFFDGDLAVNRRYGEISDEELIRAIDRLTFDHGDSRINGRPVVLKSVSWVLAGGRFCEEQALDTDGKSL
jgi:integrase